MKFRTKILLAFVISTMTTVFLGTIFFYSYVSQMVEEDYIKNAISSLTQISGSVEQSLNSINTELTVELVNPTFTDPIIKLLNNPTDRNYSNALTNTAYVLRGMRESSELISSVYLYTPQGSFDELMNPRDRTFVFTESDFTWKEGNGSITWFPAKEDSIFSTGSVVIPWVYQFFCGDRKNSRCYLIVQLEQEKLIDSIAQLYNSFDGFAVFDGDGRTILEMGETDFSFVETNELPKDSASYLLDISSNNYVFHTYIDLNGWHMVMVRDKDAITGSLNRVRTTAIVVNILIVFIGVLTVSVLVIRLTKSLKDLAAQMDCLRKGNLTARFRYNKNDEIGQMAHSFNFMAERIEDLVEMQKMNIQALKEEKEWGIEIQKQKRHAELRALQAQINPHFLYNTLNTVSWEAAGIGEKKISTLLSAMGKFFRLSLNKGAEIIPLQDEIEHVKTYLNIQQISRDVGLTYQLDIPSDLEQFPVIKLILQPLVENSLCHGIRLKDTAGFIRITATHTDDDILLEVEDDGMGIAPDKLRIMNQSLKIGWTDTKEGYGIYNVNERVKLYYGYSYGLSYESFEGCFTRAILRLPYRRVGIEDEL